MMGMLSITEVAEVAEVAVAQEVRALDRVGMCAIAVAAGGPQAVCMCVNEGESQRDGEREMSSAASSRRSIRDASDSKVEGRWLKVTPDRQYFSCSQLLGINLQHTTRNSAYMCLQIFVVKNVQVFNFRG